MSGQVYLGIDLGAESGRVMAGVWDGRAMIIEELHRFPNGPVHLAGTLRWDTLRLWSEIERGLAEGARRFGGRVQSVGVDTWALDYTLLSKSGETLGLPFNYRDARTRGVVEEMSGVASREDIFEASGLQFMEINTLPQLIAHRRQSPEIIAAADRFLMIPDYFNWLLCGASVAEFTNATTTQFFHPRRHAWSVELLEKFGLPTRMLPEVVEPGTRLGRLRPDVAARAGLGQVEVVAPATHDTGSAVAAVPTTNTGRPNWAYISSGTWSLLGVETAQAVVTPAALARNVTNEGGVDGTYRLLKNIMGLWILQRCRHAFAAAGRQLEYSDLVRLSAEAKPFESLIDPDDSRFLNPPDMPSAIAGFCRETGQPEPRSEGAIVRCALESLALKYDLVLGWIEELAGAKVEVVHIVGGGSRNDLLNQFAADACQRRVVAGPVEATVLGNLLMQARAFGELGSLAQLRQAVAASGETREFLPVHPAAWAEARARMSNLCAASTAPG
jgi:rhamnulokinase